MATKRMRATALVAVLLGLLIVGSARAHLPDDPSDDPSGARVVSAVSPLLQYQGRLTDPDTEEPVSDASYTMTFRIYDAEAGEPAVWSETEDVLVQGGVFNTVLGDTTPLDQSLFNGQALWLGIKVGGDPEATPRQAILPVAYALSLAPGAEISTSSSSPALEVNNAGAGVGLSVTATDVGLSGWGGLHGLAGVSDEGSGLHGMSEAGMGVHGESVVGAGGYFSSTEGSGVSGYSGESYGGYFYSSHGTALRAAGDTEVAGDLQVDGGLRADSLTYSSPRTHYFVVGGEAFVPYTNLDYWNFGGTGGAYLKSGAASMVAPVHLPDGAVVTRFEAFYYDASSSDMVVRLYLQRFDSGYSQMADVESSGTGGYSSVADTTIGSPTIDNARQSYFVSASSTAWDGNALRIKAAVITYRIREAP